MTIKIEKEKKKLQCQLDGLIGRSKEHQSNPLLAT